MKERDLFNMLKDHSKIHPNSAGLSTDEIAYRIHQYDSQRGQQTPETVTDRYILATERRLTRMYYEEKLTFKSLGFSETKNHWLVKE